MSCQEYTRFVWILIFFVSSNNISWAHRQRHTVLDINRPPPNGLFSFNERIFAVCWSVNGQILSVALLSGRGRWSTFFYIFLQQNKTCCNLHSLSGEFSCSLRSSLRYLNDNDMMFQFQKDTMMIKKNYGAGSESYNIHMLRLSVSIHGTSVNVPQTHEIAESAMRSQLEGDVLPI